MVTTALLRNHPHNVPLRARCMQYSTPLAARVFGWLGLLVPARSPVGLFVLVWYWYLHGGHFIPFEPNSYFEQVSVYLGIWYSVHVDIQYVYIHNDIYIYILYIYGHLLRFMAIYGYL